jgi:hypothetical protein
MELAGKSLIRPMDERPTKSGRRLLAPMERISKVLFGFITVINLSVSELSIPARKLCQD